MDRVPDMGKNAPLGDGPYESYESLWFTQVSAVDRLEDQEDNLMQPVLGVLHTYLPPEPWARAIADNGVQILHGDGAAIANSVDHIRPLRGIVGGRITIHK